MEELSLPSRNAIGNFALTWHAAVAEVEMKRKSWCLAGSIVAAALLTVPTEGAFAFRGGGHGGGGAHFGGGGHFGGIHFGGGHFGGRAFHPGGFRGFAVNRGFRMRSFARPSFARAGRIPLSRTYSAHGNPGARFAHNAIHNPGLPGSRNGRTVNPQNQAMRQAAIVAHNRIVPDRNRFLNRPAFRQANWFDRGRRGWHHHFWAGGVFWPYFFGDYFSYAFWPDDYYDAFWGWGPDVLLWSAFWPYEDYYGSAGAYGAGDIYAGYRGAPAMQNAQLAASSCTAFAPGVSDLPLQRVAQIIQPRPDQREALDELSAAVKRADDVLKTSCVSEAPLTPAARLDAMEARLKAIAQAQDEVRGPLIKLYGLLSDEQRQRLEQAAAGARRAAGAQEANLAQLCSAQAGFTDVPEDAIARAIDLSDAQKAELDRLKQVSDQAAQQLASTCPSSVPNTIETRLDAAHQRVEALIRAIEEIRPAAQTFFASLSPSQKASLQSEAQNAGRG